MQFSMIAVYIMFRFNPQVNYSSEIISREQGEVCFSTFKKRMIVRIFNWFNHRNPGFCKEEFGRMCRFDPPCIGILILLEKIGILTGPDNVVVG